VIDKSLEENKQSMINNYLKDTEVITALQSAAKGMKLVKPIAIKQPMISNWFNDTNAMKAFQSMEIGMRPIKAMQIAFPEKNFAMSKLVENIDSLFPYKVAEYKNMLGEMSKQISPLSNVMKTMNKNFSLLSEEQLNRLFIYNNSTYTDIFEELARRQTALTKNIRLFNNDFFKNLKETEKRYKDLIPTIERLSNQGWVITPYFEINELFKLKEKSSEELECFMEDYYTKNNYKQFYYEFDLLLDDFVVDEDNDRGYLNQLEKIKNLIQLDFKNSRVLINAAVSILEFKYIEAFDLEFSNSIMRERDIKAYYNQHKNDMFIVFDYLSFCSLLQVLMNFMARQEFKVGSKETQLTRHSIQHGRYNPERYKDTDFIKIILLIAATCFKKSIVSLGKENIA
jgi:hypothetical protein